MEVQTLQIVVKRIKIIFLLQHLCPLACLLMQKHMVKPQAVVIQVLMLLVCYNTSYLMLNFHILIAPRLANPVHWVSVYQKLDNLKPGTIITQGILDLYLIHEANLSQLAQDTNKQFYYLDTYVLQHMTGDQDQDHTLFKSCLSITSNQMIGVPILFLVTIGPSKYFLAMFEFSKQKALILGCTSLPSQHFTKVYAEWNSWNGPALWDKIYAAFYLPGLQSRGSSQIVYESDCIPVCVLFQ